MLCLPVKGRVSQYLGRGEQGSKGECLFSHKSNPWTLASSGADLQLRALKVFLLRGEKWDWALVYIVSCSFNCNNLLVSHCRAQTIMKARLKGAQTGRNLLKKKADALSMRFRQILRKIIEVSPDTFTSIISSQCCLVCKWIELYSNVDLSFDFPRPRPWWERWWERRPSRWLRLNLLLETSGWNLLNVPWTSFVSFARTVQ